MGLFTRTATRSIRHDVLVEQWRGRSRDLPDAGGHPWEVVMAALETSGRAAAVETGEPLAALGLASRDLPRRTGSDLGGVRLHGVRHGRQVEIRIGLRERTWGNAAAMVTWVCAASADPHLDGDREGRILPSLSAQRAVWSGVQVRGGSQGLVAFRKMSSGAHSQGYLYDLWLLEHLADLLHAEPLPPSDLSGVDVPYGMG